VFCRERHRIAVDGRLCQVCGHPFDPGEPYVFIGGAGRDLFRDPPIHPGCSRWSLRVCPGLRRHMAKLEVVVCGRYGIKVTLDDPAEPLTLTQRRLFPDQTVRWLHAVPARPQRHTPAAWLEHPSCGASATVSP
jgi:hypothetical protein